MQTKDKEMYWKRRSFLLLSLTLLSNAVSATSSFMAIPCSVIAAVYTALWGIAATLVAIMFLYGGVKYAFSADDPGGRKQGKSICIQAAIGGIFIMVWTGFKQLLVSVSPTWLSWVGCGI